MSVELVSEALTVAVDRGRHAIQLTVDGALDHWSASDLRDELEGLLGEGRTQFVVDVTGVSFVDCGGIRPLLEATAAARDRGGDVSVVGAGPRFRLVVDTLRLGPLLSLDC